MKNIAKIITIFSLCLVYANTANASVDVNLKYGAKGTEVIELQEFLISKGFLVGQATGNFYSLTLKGVRGYQSSVNLPSTGFVGPLTREKINKELDLSQSDLAEKQETGEISPPVDTSFILKQKDELQKIPQKLTQDIISVPSIVSSVPVSETICVENAQLIIATSSDGFNGPFEGYGEGSWENRMRFSELVTFNVKIISVCGGHWYIDVENDGGSYDKMGPVKTRDTVNLPNVVLTSVGKITYTDIFPGTYEVRFSARNDKGYSIPVQSLTFTSHGLLKQSEIQK